MTNINNEGVMAAIRYRESLKTDHLYKDKFAHLFISTDSFERLEKINTELVFFEDLISVRHKVFLCEIDDFLKENSDFSQIVSLGAGYCTCTLDFIESFTRGIMGFEIDRAEVLSRKTQILGTEYLPRCVPYDFGTPVPNLIQSLRISGFDVSARTLFFMEGVLYYLSPDATLNFLREMSLFLKSTNSFLMFDMQIGPNKLLDKEREVAKNMGLSEKYNSLSNWTRKVESMGMSIFKYFNLGIMDKWKRLYQQKEFISSSFFLVGNKL